MPTCQYCVSKSCKTDEDLARHQKTAVYCRQQRELEEVARIARICPQLHSDSESDLEYGDEDGFADIYGPVDADDAFHVYMPPILPDVLPADLAAAAARAVEAASTPDEPDADDEDGFVQVYPLAAKLYDPPVAPPLQVQYDTIPRADNFYAPFASREDWELALWAKTNAISDSSFTRLLAINGVCGGMKSSYKNAGQLNDLIDTLPLPARFKHTAISVTGEVGTYDLFFCDPLDVLRELLADPTFEDDVTWAAEKCYDKSQCRLWTEMTSGDWMWAKQGKIKVGGTVIPIILSTDKTQLTAFSGDHCAYPVYMSIGNIAKHVRRMPSRRAFRLIGYLPTLKPDETTMSEAQARRIRMRLFHKAMEVICESLFQPAQDGIFLPDSKGNVRNCFPILASYIADYPEQCLVTCVRYGQTCPKCKTSCDRFGDHILGDPRHQQETIDTINLAREARSADERDSILKSAGLNNVIPFYARWAHVDIHEAITSDNLHQNIQGVGAALVQWLTDIIGEKELDARLARLPPAHNLRNFSHGISCLSRVSGAERKAIYSQLIGGIIGRVPSRAVRAARALLDCILIAQFECHSDETLASFKENLDEFHRNKAVFLESNPNTSALRSAHFLLLMLRTDFHFPKMHMLEHYEPCIRQAGTTDNYNTECTERMHIENAKEAFKATNRRDFIIQMCRWLERRQAVHQFAVWLAWKRGEKYDARRRRPRKLAISPIVLAKAAPLRKTVADLVSEHGVVDFQGAMRLFLQKWHGVDVAHYDMPLPHGVSLALNTLHDKQLHVWHQVKFLTPDLQTVQAPDVLDIAHATSQRPSRRQKTIKARFDTVLVETKGNGVAGIGGLKDVRVGRLRAIFQFPAATAQLLFHPQDPPTHLAVVEWFSRPTPSRRDPYSKMFRISRSYKTGRQKDMAIIDVLDLRRSCHLLPAFGAEDVKRSLTSYTVLDAFDDFFLNDFVDKHAYRTM